MSKHTRAYSMSDAELCMFTSTLIVWMERDESEFINRAVTVLDRTDLESKGNAFEVLPPDAEYLYAVKVAVDQKEALRESLTIQVQLITGFVEQMWGLDSNEYEMLKIGRFQAMSDTEFIKKCRFLHRKGTDWLTELSGIGLTQGILDTFNTDAQSFEDTENLIEENKNIRKEKTQERVEKGNEIFALVSKYCKIGRLIWENVDPIKEENYIIRKSVKHPPGQVTGVSYDTESFTLSWDGMSDATDYLAEYAPDFPDPIYIEFWSGEETSTVYNPGGPAAARFRVRARNADGLGPWSEVLIVPMV